MLSSTCLSRWERSSLSSFCSSRPFRNNAITRDTNTRSGKSLATQRQLLLWVLCDSDAEEPKLKIGFSVPSSPISHCCRNATSGSTLAALNAGRPLASSVTAVTRTITAK